MKPLRILVTGASSGVGWHTARLLSSMGHRVLGISTRRPAEAPAGENFEWRSMDLSDPVQREKDLEAWPWKLSEFDVLVLNAGLGELGAVEETPLDSSRRLFEVNYWANVWLVQKALHAFRQRGSGVIVAMGSIVTELHLPFKAQYSASKAALTAMLDSLRHELQGTGLRVHVLEPGWIRSEFHQRLSPVQPTDSAYAHRFGPFLDFSQDQNPKYPDGMDVALRIAACIQNPKSPFRQAVGPDAKAFFAFRWLPFWFRDWVIRRHSS